MAALIQPSATVDESLPRYARAAGVAILLSVVFGVLFMIAGFGFFLRTATFILAPAYSTNFMLMPIALALIPFMLWLLIRGVGKPAPAAT